MVRSEIFDSYAKIAEELGLISNAYPNNDESVKALEKNPRWGSDDLSAIEILYGVKPNGKEDDTSIIEKAHSETCVLSESYDRMNGVVENEIQRHNVMVDIALRPADGNYTGKRYVHAKTQLLDNLVKVGFLMDSQDKVELMNLADACSENLVKEAGFMDTLKEFSGAIPGLLGGAAGIGAGILIGSNPLGWIVGIGAGIAGAIAVFNNIQPASQGVLNNAKNALTQIQEAQGTVPKAKSVLDSAQGLLTEFLPIAEQYMQTEPPANDHSELNLQGVAKIFNNAEEKQKLQIVNQYVQKCKELKFKLSPMIVKLKAAEEDRDQSNLPKGLDYAAKLFNSIWTPAIKDVYLSLETLSESLDEVAKKAVEGRQEAQGTIERLNEQADQMKEKLNIAPKEEIPTPQPKAIEPPQEENEETVIPNFFEQLNKNLKR